MCYYIKTLHMLCGCKTIALLSPNLCRVAIRNSMPCPYVAPGQESLNTVPSLTLSPSTISSRTFSTQSFPDPNLSLDDFAASLQHQAFFARLNNPEDDSFHRDVSRCPFHMEERLEILEENSGRQQRDDVAKRVVRKKESQSKRKKDQRLAAEREEGKKLAEQAEEIKRLTEEMVRERFEQERGEKKRKREDSPKKFGEWTSQMIWRALADGTGVLREQNGNIFMVTETTTHFLVSF